jgi:hypothetical protein
MGYSRYSHLGEYNKKRKFSNTPEPAGKTYVKATSRQVSNEKTIHYSKA